MSALVAPPRLCLVGSALCVLDGGQTLALERKDALMLAYLVIEGPTPRRTLATLLWPEVDEERALANLRQRLFRLRKAVGFDLLEGAAVASLAGRVQVDLATGVDATGDVLSAIGDAEAGGLSTWFAATRRRRRALRIDALAVEVGRLERDGDFGPALAAAQALLDCEPTSEHAHRQLMRLHYLRSDRSAALLAFDRCERMLKDEVGARPSPETLALLQTIELADPTSGSLKVAAIMPAALLRPPRLVGRRGELAAALDAWGQGRAFCLEGEGGMGKSRLLQEIAARHAGTVAVQARPGDAVVPYATLGRLLRALLTLAPAGAVAPLHGALFPVLPELGGGDRAGDGGSQRLALGRAVLGVVAVAVGQGVDAVIVDDLHFADDASLEMLLQLARGDESVLHWGFARRPAEGSAALTALCEALLEEQRLEPVPLVPLDREQLAELLGSLGLAQVREAEFAAALHRHSGGNPMFALETLRQAWSDPVAPGAGLPRPMSVTRMIERRVMRLSPAAVRLARCAAVAGVDFSIELAGVVLAVPVIDLADPWSELEQAHVFVDGAFAHDLIHEAVRAGLPKQIARHLHGEVARHLEMRDAPPASVAAHWLAADQALRSLPFEHRAGQLAAAQRRFAEAAAAYEREARLRLGQGDAAGAFAAALCMREAAFELDLGGRTDSALELLDQAAATPQHRAAAAAERAIVCMHRGAMAEAERAVVAGLSALGDAAEPALRVKLTQHLAAVRVWQQRPADAFELLRSVEHDVEAGSDAEARIEFAQALAIVLEHLDRPGEAMRWSRRAADASLAAGRLPQAAQTLLNLAIGWRDSGRLEQAVATLEEARTLLASLPEGAIPYSSLDLNYGIVMRDLGRYGESLEWLDRAIERGRQHVPGWVALFLCHRAQVWITLGQVARAGQDLDAAGADDAPPLAQARRELLRAQWLGLLGQSSGAAFERAAALLGPNARALTRQRLTLARCVVLEPAEALAAAGQVLDEAMVAQRPGVIAAARTRLCEAALALGHVAEAARHARLLAALGAVDGCDEIYRGETWLVAWRALAGPDPQRAAALLQSAACWVRETASDRVPEPFRESFLHRNPVNRELLSLAGKRPA